MPEKRTMERARRARRQGKAPSTQAGEFVREEIHHVHEGRHGARSVKQAIAIGLSKARRAGVAVGGRKGAAKSTRGRRATAAGRGAEARGRGAAGVRRGASSGGGRGKASTRRAQASQRALRREGHGAASHRALARQGRAAASRRPPSQRSAAAHKAARTRRENRTGA